MTLRLSLGCGSGHFLSIKRGDARSWPFAVGDDRSFRRGVNLEVNGYGVYGEVPSVDHESGDFSSGFLSFGCLTALVSLAGVCYTGGSVCSTVMASSVVARVFTNWTQILEISHIK